MKSATRFTRVGAAVMTAVMLAACSGTANSGFGGTGVTPNMRTVAPATAVPIASERRRGKAKISIRIPHRKAHGRRMHPEYISASTQSMTVTVAGGAVPKQTFNLTPASGGCSASGGFTTCNEIAFLPPGQQTIAIALYDQTGGQGNQLSTASEQITIVAGSATDVSITLDGVPSSATVLLNGSAADSIPQGVATSVPATVTAKDADGNIIMSPGNYATPIALADSDTSGATTLSATSVTAPGAAVTLAYNGGTISSATITPSISGSAQSSGAAVLTLTSSSSPSPSPFPSPAITQHALPPCVPSICSASEPEGIVDGPDGALWFAERFNQSIGRMTSDGTISEYSLPTPLSYPYSIATGSDGALWFTEVGPNQIGRLTTGGALTEYPTTPDNGYQNLNMIAPGPDGALWYTEEGTNAIGRITTSGAITEYSIPTSNSFPNGIVAGADGALWFTEARANQIARITTGGTVTEYSVPTSGSEPYTIAAGSDGALWFTEASADKIARITTGGAVTEYSLPAVRSGRVAGIAAGPDGALWFTAGPYDIGRITTNGAVAVIPLPPLSASLSAENPGFIAAGPGKSVWVTEYPSSIAGVQLSSSPAVTSGRCRTGCVPGVHAQPRRVPSQ